MKLKEKMANAKAYVQKNQKKFVLMMCSIVIVGGMVAGTLAWLAARTNPVINNFIGSDLVIDLQETARDYPMIPSQVLEKDPKVIVEDGSEACWLFLQVKESDAQANGSGIIVTQGETKTEITRSGENFRYLDYTVITTAEDKQNEDDLIWTKLTPQDVGKDAFPSGISYYCCEVEEEGTELAEDIVIPILKDNQVRVFEYIINAELDTTFLEEHPVTITFTPVAIQKLGFGSVDSAFSMIETEFENKTQ